MRTLLSTLLLTLTLWGAPDGCPSGCDDSGCGIVNAAHYALQVMKRDSDPDIRLAFLQYRAEHDALCQSPDTTAFREGRFDRDRFLRNDTGVRQAVARADLFEAIYRRLDRAQAQKFYELVNAHLYYLSQFRTADGLR